MHISLLQPHIIRGDIAYNAAKVQQLINQSAGELLVLPEYVLTGSLVLDAEANVRAWARQSAEAATGLRIPDGKTVLLDMLLESNGVLYNATRLLPGDERQSKVYLDPLEAQAGMTAGERHLVFSRGGLKFKIAICTDFRYREDIPGEDADFLVWVSHFSQDNYLRSVDGMQQYAQREGIPVLASSPISDKNVGRSTFVSTEAVVSLSQDEGILEIELG